MVRTNEYIMTVILGAVTAISFASQTSQTPPAQPAQGSPPRSTPQQPMPPGANPNSQYRLGPDSLPQEGVPKGEIRGPFTLPSNVYAGTQHTYWVYVPAQYDNAVPAALMVFQDGHAFKNENGDIRAQNSRILVIQRVVLETPNCSSSMRPNEISSAFSPRPITD